MLYSLLASLNGFWAQFWEHHKVMISESVCLASCGLPRLFHPHREALSGLFLEKMSLVFAVWTLTASCLLCHGHCLHAHTTGHKDTLFSSPALSLTNKKQWQKPLPCYVLPEVDKHWNDTHLDKPLKGSQISSSSMFEYICSCPCQLHLPYSISPAIFKIQHKSHLVKKPCPTQLAHMDFLSHHV